jgi:hypothetical protein
MLKEPVSHADRLFFISPDNNNGDELLPLPTLIRMVFDLNLLAEV